MWSVICARWCLHNKLFPLSMSTMESIYSSRKVGGETSRREKRRSISLLSVTIYLNLFTQAIMYCIMWINWRIYFDQVVAYFYYKDIQSAFHSFDVAQSNSTLYSKWLMNILHFYWRTYVEQTIKGTQCSIILFITEQLVGHFNIDNGSSRETS